jgi:hypothetical protein
VGGVSQFVPGSQNLTVLGQLWILRNLYLEPGVEVKKRIIFTPFHFQGKKEISKQEDISYHRSGLETRELEDISYHRPGLEARELEDISYHRPGLEARRHQLS